MKGSACDRKCSFRYFHYDYLQLSRVVVKINGKNSSV